MGNHLNIELRPQPAPNLGWKRALGAGAAGAAILTLSHELMRKLIPHPPRMDLVGMRLLQKGSRFAGKTPPKGDRLYGLAMLGDIVANTVYYALAATGARRPSLLRGAIAGGIAGWGAWRLPPLLGLGAKGGRN